MNHWYVWLILAMVWSCSTTPQVYNERSYPPPASEVIETGVVVYHDNQSTVFSRPGTENRLDLEARIIKEQSALAHLLGDPTRKLVQTSTLSGEGPSTGFTWVCEYRFQPDEGRGDYEYHIYATRVPASITNPTFLIQKSSQEESLPFEVFRALWQGVPVRVVATRDLGMFPSPGVTSNTWQSFLDYHQKFQVVGPDDVVLAELVGPDGNEAFRFKVFDTTPVPPSTTMKELLAMVASLNRFLYAVDQYRRGWSPDVRQSPPGAMADWPAF